jgi:hypothetical protein
MSDNTKTSIRFFDDREVQQQKPFPNFIDQNVGFVFQP